MRILMIAHTNAPWTPHFARFFTERGDTLRVVSFAPHKLDGVDGIDVEFVGIEPFDLNKNKYVFITSIPRIRKIVRAFQPDLVFAPYLFSNGLSAVLSWKGPIVVSAVGGDVQNIDGWSGLGLLFREAIIRYVCRRAQIVNAVSQPLRDALIRRGVPSSKVLVLPFGVDVAMFYPHPDMPRNPAVNLICTRKHEPVYDIPTIINALAQLKSSGRVFHCTFTCDGSLLERHKVQAAASGLNDYVTFTGNLPHGELPLLLRSADIYISASLSDGTSVALLEALASGLLPVVTRIPANTPWIKHGETGLLFVPGRAEDLTEMISQAMDNAALRQEAFNHNRQLVDQQANMNKNMDHLADIFSKLVSGQIRDDFNS